MTYRLTPAARADIEAIAAYVAEHDPQAAVRLIERLMRRWRLLSTAPMAGAARPDIAEGIRLIVTGPYLSFYRIEQTGIVIVRILHGRRDVGRQAPFDED